MKKIETNEEKIQEKKKNQRKKFLFGTILGVILAVLMVAVPLPYYIEAPGSADSLNDVIEVNGEKDSGKGSLYMTTVGVYRANGINLLASRFNSFTDVVTRDELYGGATSKEYNMIQKYYLETSQNNAQVMALKTAGLPYEMEFKGIYVMEILPGSDFSGKLDVGDLITAVDGQKFESSQAFIDYVRSKKDQDKIEVTYTRDINGKSEEKTVSGKLKVLKDTKRPSIGIQLIDHTALNVPNYDIKFNLENVGGPSAGMMFTLELYSMLAKKDLKKGRNIAGTGTMEIDGTIGRIGGIEKKVYAANRQGVEIFLAPDDTIDPEVKAKHPEVKSNYEEAVEAGKKLKTNMKIVPVKTLDDAISYLEKN